MVSVGSSFFTVSDPAPCGGGSEAAPIVVWLWGEHDLSADDAPCVTLTSAIALEGTGLVLDLAQVGDMGAPTPGIKTTSVDQNRRRPQGPEPRLDLNNTRSAQ
jgi:hypothetical protein